MTRKVTIDDIARRSNASASTVSLVLRNKRGISAETRQRVLDAARELGYRRRAWTPDGAPPPGDPPRDALTVGLVLRARNRAPDLSMPVVNPFYSWVLTGIEAAARPRGANLLYATLPVDDENRPLDLPHQLLDQPLDGLLLIGAFGDDVVAEVAGARPTPIVLVDAPATPHRHDAVASDNRGGAYEAASHLIRRGHRHIALAGLPQQADPNFRERRDGYLQALREHGLTEYAIAYGEAQRDGADPADALLRRHPEISAICGSNDHYAIAALRAARALGRRVPEDLSIIGFDDIELAVQITPQLTTMAVDKVSMGRLALQTLAHRLAWPDAATTLTLLRPRLIERDTVAGR